MSDIKEIELHVAMDEEGDWGHGQSAEDAVDDYQGNYTLAGPLRIARLKIRMSMPVVVEANPVDVPDEDTTVEVKS